MDIHATTQPASATSFGDVPPPSRSRSNDLPPDVAAVLPRLVHDLRGQATFLSNAVRLLATDDPRATAPVDFARILRVQAELLGVQCDALTLLAADIPVSLQPLDRILESAASRLHEFLARGPFVLKLRGETPDIPCDRRRVGIVATQLIRAAAESGLGEASLGAVETPGGVDVSLDSRQPFDPESPVQLALQYFVDGLRGLRPADDIAELAARRAVAVLSATVSMTVRHGSLTVSTLIPSRCEPGRPLESWGIHV